MATRRILSKYLYPPDPAFAERVDAYVEELNKLYAQIEAWLPESAQADRTDTVFEYWDGHYDAPAMNIRYGDVNLRLVPPGISLSSGSLVYFVVNPERRDSCAREAHILKNNNDEHWFEVRKTGDSSPKLYSFDRESFIDFLDEIVAYS
jgi:hypothetical protein